MKKITIKGCDGRGDGDTPYLTRHYLIQWKYLHVYLHKFHRDDSDELHDHPWHFISIVLWNGYIEETFRKPPKLRAWSMLTKCVADKARYYDGDENYVWPLSVYETKKKRIYPGQIIFRKATHAHRVDLINGKPAYTLLINFGYVRQWGFFTKNYWQHFKSYFQDNGCNTVKAE